MTTPLPIAPRTEVARPTISVVIPTYEPQHYLIQTVKSVLDQDLGPEQMQITIVDDASSRTRPAAALSGQVPLERIELREHCDQLGLAGNWNRAIEYARGDLIHILHQDDVVAHGFYAALLSGIGSSPHIGMGFCRHAFIDEHDRVQRISHRERWRPGILRHWLDRISEKQRLQCPAAIVRREVYERLGGFRANLKYTLDWEMWARIAANYDVWYEPRVLASYRRHTAAESARLEQVGATTSEMVMTIEVIASHVPAAQRARMQQKALLHLARAQVKRASKLLKNGSAQLATAHLETARTALAQLPQSVAKQWLQSRLTRIQTP